MAAKPDFSHKSRFQEFARDALAKTFDHNFSVIEGSVPHYEVIKSSLDGALAVLEDIDYDMEIASEDKTPDSSAGKYSFRRELLLDNMEMMFRELSELNNGGDDDDSVESSTDEDDFSFGDELSYVEALMNTKERTRVQEQTKTLKKVFESSL